MVITMTAQTTTCLVLMVTLLFDRIPTVTALASSSTFSVLSSSCSLSSYNDPFSSSSFCQYYCYYSSSALHRQHKQRQQPPRFTTLLLAKGKAPHDKEEEEEEDRSDAPDDQNQNQNAKDNLHGDDEDLPTLGMEDAFRKLDSLESLDNDKTTATSISEKASPSSSASSSGIPLEKEVEVYKKLIGELESKEDVYGNVLADMETTKGVAHRGGQKQGPSGEETLVRDDFAMQQALADALQEVSQKGNQPPAADSILNDKDIMKEIEAIMERGNAQLLESLEEMRREQQAYAKSKASKNAQQAMDEYEAVQAARLEAAEKAVGVWLQRVKDEQKAVQQAVDDLTAAQKEMGGGSSSGLVSKLRRGGIPKQMALVGLVLFSVRSIVDSVASLGDSSMLAPALIQGGIALACAAFLFLL